MLPPCADSESLGERGSMTTVGDVFHKNWPPSANCNSQVFLSFFFFFVYAVSIDLGLNCILSRDSWTGELG